MSELRVWDTVYTWTRPKQLFPGVTRSLKRRKNNWRKCSLQSCDKFWTKEEFFHRIRTWLLRETSTTWLLHSNLRCCTLSCARCCGNPFWTHVVRCRRCHHSILIAKPVNIVTNISKISPVQLAMASTVCSVDMENLLALLVFGGRTMSQPVHTIPQCAMWSTKLGKPLSVLEQNHEWLGRCYPICVMSPIV